MLNITQNKTYSTGDVLICIIDASSDLSLFQEYIVEKFEDNRVHLNPGYGSRTKAYNPGRFISKVEIRDSKLHKILN